MKSEVCVLARRESWDGREEAEGENSVCWGAAKSLLAREGGELARVGRQVAASLQLSSLNGFSSCSNGKCCTDALVVALDVSLKSDSALILHALQMVVGCIVEHEGQVLMCRWEVYPGLVGLWRKEEGRGGDMVRSEWSCSGEKQCGMRKGGSGCRSALLSSTTMSRLCFR